MSVGETAVPDSVTYREVQEILRTFGESGWTGMTLRVRGMTVTVGKHGPPATAAVCAAAPAAAAAGPVATPAAGPVAGATPPTPTGAPSDTVGLVAVRSPAIGAFWTAPAPGQPPFVEVGSVVEAGDQLAIVEVMKLMNPVITDVGGEIVEMCAKNAEMVEYDQPLFKLRPTNA